MIDRYRFLNPWTLLLPEEGPCVLAVAGSGGKTTLLRRLLRHFRARERSVIWTQTVEHPAPIDLPRVSVEDTGAMEAALSASGAVFVGPDGAELPGGLSRDQLDRLVASQRADVVLVEAHARTGTPLRDDGVAPRWPSRCDRAFLVANFSAVGRPWSSRVVAGSAEPERRPGEEPVRVSTEDVLARYRADGGLLAQAPTTGLVVPFLTGFGSFRDMDGMFQLVQELWASPRVKAVCLAELIGDPRRDAADGVEPGGPGPGPAGERVYALYPAELDED